MTFSQVGVLLLSKTLRLPNGPLPFGLDLGNCLLRSLCLLLHHASHQYISHKMFANNVIHFDRCQYKENTKTGSSVVTRQLD